MLKNLAEKVSVFASAFGLASLIACAPSSQGTASTLASTQPEASAQGLCVDRSNDGFAGREELCELVNKARVENGLAPLTLEVKRSSAAQKHAVDMFTHSYFSHESQDGRQVSDRLKAEGLTLQAWGENIAQGQETPADVMTSWMNSPGHRANLLNPNYHKIGLGMQGLYWVQDFTN